MSALSMSGHCSRLRHLYVRVGLQGVHSLFEGSPARPWGPSEKRTSRMVFIGRELDGELLKVGFKNLRWWQLSRNRSPVTKRHASKCPCARFIKKLLSACASMVRILVSQVLLLAHPRKSAQKVK